MGLTLWNLFKVGNLKGRRMSLFSDAFHLMFVPSVAGGFVNDQLCHDFESKKISLQIRPG